MGPLLGLTSSVSATLDLGPTTWVIGAVAVFVVVGVIASLSKTDIYDEVGAGGLSIGDGHVSPGPTPGSPADRVERELEIRQMLQARNDRLQRRGEPPIDIDAELAMLLETPTAPAGAAGEHDPELVEEVRQLVVARNERRARRGEEPLDVDQEVARTLAEFDPSA
jgi:hypothetical protein